MVKSDVTIRTSHGDVLWDSSWTAGVEHEEDADDRDYETEAEESDDESEDSSDEEMDEDEEISPEHALMENPKDNGWTRKKKQVQQQVRLQCS